MSKQISLEQVIDTISVTIHDSSDTITVEQDFMEFDGNSVTVKYDRKFHLPVYGIEHDDQEFVFEDLNGIMSEEVKLVFEQGQNLMILLADSESLRFVESDRSLLSLSKKILQCTRS